MTAEEKTATWVRLGQIGAGFKMPFTVTQLFTYRRTDIEVCLTVLNL